MQIVCSMRWDKIAKLDFFPSTQRANPIRRILHFTRRIRNLCCHWGCVDENRERNHRNESVVDSLTFDFRAGDGVHVERYQLEKSVRIHRNWRDVKKCTKLFQHLNSTCLEWLHSVNEIRYNVNRFDDIHLQLHTRFSWRAFHVHAGTISQISCSIPSDPSDAVLHLHCSRHPRHCWPMGPMAPSDEHVHRLRDESTSLFVNIHRIAALSLWALSDSSPHACVASPRTVSCKR